MDAYATPLTLSDPSLSLTQSETIEIEFTDVKTEASETSISTFSPTTPLTLSPKWSANSSSGHYTHTNSDDTIFRRNGYRKLKRISTTLQGELFKAIKMDKYQSNVCIKKISKYLCDNQITNEDGYSICVSKNVIKEALLLKYLTIINQCIGGYIVNYIDFFESNTDYYLVQEYISSETNLKQFVHKANEYINAGILPKKEYQKMIKYLFWQLCVTVQWIHHMSCAHLDLVSENIMIMNADFIQTKNGMYINPKISVKISDFGVAELFNGKQEDPNKFLCYKQHLSIFNETYAAPNVFKGRIYNAICADNYSLGMILYECMRMGQKLYEPFEIYQYKSAYWSIYHDQLHEYFSANNLLKYFNFESFNLLNNLLHINEKQRLNGMNILTHKWFKLYFDKYRKQIIKKFHREE